MKYSILLFLNNIGNNGNNGNIGNNEINGNIGN